MRHQAFSKIWILAILIIIFAVGIFIWQYFGAPAQEARNETANWKTYQNKEYGFEMEYPSGVTFSSTGPNTEQQALYEGKQVSGTTQPSYDTIIFSDNNKELGKIEIFHKYEKDILPKNYKDEDYLYLYGPCDVRWGFQAEDISLSSDSKTLIVQGKDQNNNLLECRYSKNPAGNLIVLSNKWPEIFDQMLSTFRFLE